MGSLHVSPGEPGTSGVCSASTKTVAFLHVGAFRRPFRRKSTSEANRERGVSKTNFTLWNERRSSKKEVKIVHSRSLTIEPTEEV